MSFLYINEYAGLAQSGQGDSVPILPDPPTVTQKFALTTGASAVSAPLQPSTLFVEIEADTICNFVIGTAGAVATIANMRLNANERIIRRVTPQNSQPINNQPAVAIAAIGNTT